MNCTFFSNSVELLGGSRDHPCVPSEFRRGRNLADQRFHPNVRRQAVVRFRMSEFAVWNVPMINDSMRHELLAMRDEDLRVREELMASGELGGKYVPRMESVHKRNASRLRELIDLHGWPDEDIAGKDGSEAAWLIAQHAIGEPQFQRYVLNVLHVSIAMGHVPAWHAAYLEDRIAMYEG